MHTIAITMGEPAGIGPELAVKAAEYFHESARILLFGSRDILREAQQRYTPTFLPEVIETTSLTFSQLKIKLDIAAQGLAALSAVDEATRWALDKKVNALVTAPISKQAINLAHIPFQGHTEYIAQMCNTKRFQMQQSAKNLHVVFTTTHIPLINVCQVLTVEKIVETTLLLCEGLRQEGIQNPKIGMAGLNPHAGEGGFMGREEIDLILPAILQLRALGIEISDPIPPDVLFLPHVREKRDGIVTHYHDQGHIPFKLLAFNSGVNSTLGLPIIRTSPDHGTAYDIAWEGRADTGSLFAAVALAIKKADYLI